jgi:nucleoside triphosphatase
MKTRICAIGIIRNAKGEILVSKMPPKRGAYPDQWGILGGGMDEGEKLIDTLQREAMEELGIKIKNIEPFTFHDDERDKYFADGHQERIYMVYCIYDCEYASGEVTLNDEWEEYKWVGTEKLKNLDFNEPTIKTFKLKGWL